MMTTKQPAVPGILRIQQDAIEAYEPTLRKFFAQVLGMDYDGVLVTDIAQLKDFAFAGEDQPDLDQYPDLKSAYAGWDKWVLERTCDVFSLEKGSFDTRITMTQLMSRIEERTARQVH